MFSSHNLCCRISNTYLHFIKPFSGRFQRNKQGELGLDRFSDRKDFERKQKVDKALIGLCFFCSAAIGYFLANYLLF
jgi:hypothetical protein